MWRAEWLKEGQNSAFFRQKKASQRQTRNLIHSLHCVHGGTVDDQAGVMCEAVFYFKELLQTNGSE